MRTSETKDERAALIDHMLTAVEGELFEKKRQNEFIESLRDQFDKNDDLSDKQIEALRKFYDRVG